MNLTPKSKRRIKQIIPFALIWFIFSLIYSLVEYGLLGSLDHYPSTGVPYDFEDNLGFTLIGSTLIGLLQGWIEVSWLRKRFERKTLWVKIVLKILFYLLFVMFFLSLLGTVNGVLNHTNGDWGKAFEDLIKFVNNFAFWSLILFISVVLGLAILISEISQYLGDGVLYNFFFGKYHTAKQETRIFMFLDMKSSTTIAEQMGHASYFDLLKTYYADMTDAILETSGEIYQYVGDEIVLSWSKEEGVYKNNCIRCFAKIVEKIEERRDFYLKDFGVVPAFKAGFHIGEVTTGEIGIIKKDIIYTGDVLNTTARIQALCNSLDVDILISKELIEHLHFDSKHEIISLGIQKLRGRDENIELLTITKS